MDNHPNRNTSFPGLAAIQKLYSCLWNQLHSNQPNVNSKSLFRQINPIGEVLWNGEPIQAESCTILDVSALGVDLPCGMSKIYVRKVYRKVEMALLELKVDKDVSVSYIVAGQPGIGKSTMLSYLLVRCLLAGVPCIFQHDQTVYSFDSSGCFILTDAETDEMYSLRVRLFEQPCWVFCDGIPLHFLRRFTYGWRIIQSTPAGTRFMSWAEYTERLIVRYMDVWTSDELFLAFKYANDIPQTEATFNQLLHILKLTGRVPRAILSVYSPDATIHAVKLAEYERYITRNIDKLLHIYRMRRFNVIENCPTDMIGSILILRPYDFHTIKYATAWSSLAPRYRIGIRTREVASLLFRRRDKKREKHIWEILDKLDPKRPIEEQLRNMDMEGMEEGLVKEIESLQFVNMSGHSSVNYEDREPEALPEDMLPIYITPEKELYEMLLKEQEAMDAAKLQETNSGVVSGKEATGEQQVVSVDVLEGPAVDLDRKDESDLEVQRQWRAATLPARLGASGDAMEVDEPRSRSV